MTALLDTLLVAAIVATGLATGLLYGFACAVMPGLGQVGDRAFLAALGSINRKIINPWFLVTFVGSPVLILGVVVAAFVAGGPQPWVPITAAAVMATLSVTITGTINVPLNTALDAAGEASSIADPAAVRARFETRWVRANVARTVASTAAFGFLVWAVTIGR